MITNANVYWKAERVLSGFHKDNILEERLISFLTGFAKLFLKFVRGVNDQRILGFLSLGIGILNIWQTGNNSAIYTNIPNALPLYNGLNLDMRIYVDLMIVCGATLLLSKDTSFRWFTALTVPLQLFILTAYMNSRSLSNTAVNGQYVQLEHIVIAIMIYRQIVKLSLLEIINTTYNNESSELRGEEDNAKSRPVIASSDNWLTVNSVSNSQGVVSGEKPVDKK